MLTFSNMCLGDNELHEFEDVQNVDDVDIM